MLIKFCGMRNAETLELAASLGVNFCGFIFYPESPRFIPAEIVRKLPSFGMARTGVFVGQSEDEVREIANLARLDFIQMHGNYSAPCAARLGKERIIRVVWPERFKNIEELNQTLENFASTSAFFLLDAGKSLGGSGKSQNMDFLKGLISPLPWFLAGGISPENIETCLKRIEPDGLDINSGLESSPGVKDMNKMKNFFLNLHKLGKYGDRA